MTEAVSIDVVSHVRRALAEIGSGAGSAESIPEEEFFPGLYPVPAHVKAFDLDRILVVGGRGTGKTQLFRTLLDARGREAVAGATGVRLIQPIQKTMFVEAFSAGRSWRADSPPHPAADVIESVVGDGGPELGAARRLWLGLSLARLAIDPQASSLPGGAAFEALDELRQRVASPRELTAWVQQDPERPYRILDELDRRLLDTGVACVFTLDGLDRTANTWPALQIVVAAILSLALDLARRLHRVRFKIFLRPDLETAGAKAFPDASKLRGYREELAWSVGDLYRLAVKRALAGDEPSTLTFFRGVLGHDALVRRDVLGWTPLAATPPQFEERLMAALVGKYMGANPQKGRTHTWLPNHLADSLTNVSPRSFLVGIGEAARQTEVHRAPQGKVLSPRALQEGVVRASEQRVEELAEDFPWIREATRHLNGLLVPCAQEDVRERLDQCDFSATPPPGPRRPDSLGTLTELIELGVLSKQPDGRINVPDLYRVAMRMKRRGGIKPVR